MKKIKELFKFMTGYKGIYVLAMICIILSQMVTIVSPLIIRTTIDSIIGSEPIGSNFLERLIQYIGGRAYLRKNLWIIGVLLVFIAILRGILLYFRNTLASKTAENTAKNIRDSLYDQIQRLPYEYHVKAERRNERD